MKSNSAFHGADFTKNSTLFSKTPRAETEERNKVNSDLESISRLDLFPLSFGSAIVGQISKILSGIFFTKFVCKNFKDLKNFPYKTMTENLPTQTDKTQNKQTTIPSESVQPGQYATGEKAQIASASSRSIPPLQMKTRSSRYQTMSRAYQCYQAVDPRPSTVLTPRPLSGTTLLGVLGVCFLLIGNAFLQPVLKRMKRSTGQNDLPQKQTKNLISSHYLEQNPGIILVLTMIMQKLYKQNLQQLSQNIEKRSEQLKTDLYYSEQMCRISTNQSQDVELKFALLHFRQGELTNRELDLNNRERDFNER